MGVEREGGRVELNRFEMELKLDLAGATSRAPQKHCEVEADANVVRITFILNRIL